MKTLVFATNNKHKLGEVRAALEGRVEVVSLAEAGLAGGDRAFLFKASRGMHLEKLYAYTKALLEGADS